MSDPTTLGTLTDPTADPPAADPTPDVAQQPASEGSWLESLPEDLRGNETLSTFKSVDDLAKSYVEARKKIGNNVAIPGKDATDEERAAFFAKLGRPEKPEDYQLPTEGIPENLQANEALLQAMAANAHEAGLTTEQYAKLYRGFMTTTAEIQQAEADNQKATVEQGLNSLKTEWGPAYEERVALALQAVDQFGGQALKDYLNETGSGNDPRMIRAFSEIGKALASDEILGGGSGKKFGMTPSEAQAEISKLQLDADFMAAYNDQYHQGHKSAMDRMAQLYEVAHSQTE